jgi:DNA-directed RNA polymerase specialized sigma24 family protein
MRPNLAVAGLEETVLPDATLVHRIAAVSDKAAWAELHARHGMSLYALAYSFLFDPDVADAVVAAVFREVWRSAASFDGRERSVSRWLVGLTHHGVAERLRNQMSGEQSGEVRRQAPRPKGRRRPWWLRLVSVAAGFVFPTALLS